MLEPEGVSLDVEFMDSKRFSSDEDIKKFGEALQQKLERIAPYDVIMTADDNAFNFALAHRQLFHNAPLVFFGVNDAGLARTMAKEPGITGVIESASLLQTAKMAASMTGSSTVLVVSDDTTSGRSDLASLQSRMAEAPGIRFVVLSLARMTFASMVSRLGTFPDSTPVLLLSAYKDRGGKTVDFSEGLKIIIGSGHPVFHMWEHGLGQGVVGGKIVSHETQGRLAAQMVLSILRGISLADIPVVEGEDANRMVFDYTALRRYGISIGRVPPNAEVRNRPQGFLEEYSMVIVPTVIVLLALLGTIAILWIANRRIKGIGVEMKQDADTFKSLFYDNNSCMLLIEPDTGKICDANKAAIDFYGYSHEVLTSLNISDINVLSEEEIKRRMGLAVGMECKAFQFIHRLANGEERFVEVYSGPVQVRGKQMLYSIVHDVTDRIQAGAKLSMSEERLRAVFESARDLIYIKDAHRRYAAINPVMERMFGDIKNKTDKEVFGQIDGSNIIESDVQALAGKSVEIEIRLPVQGVLRAFHTIKTPLYDQEGHIVGLCGIARDVTERKIKDEAHRQALAEAEAANKAKDQFLSNMSHELRTPLNGVFGMLQLLARSGMAVEQQNYVDMAMLSSRNLLRIINDILDFSTLKSGEMPLLEQEFDLRAIIQAVSDSFSSEIRTKGLHLEMELDADIPSLLVGDESKLHQVLSNLVGNAVKYTDQGGVTIRVDALSGPGQGRYLIEITDTGIGIPENKLDYVFEAFAQVDDSDTRKYQGTGLGLGIVRHLIQLMNGSISVTSQEGEGTSIFISLPLGNAEPHEARAEAVKDEHGARRHMHVLVVDDDMMNLKMTERILDKLGHSAALAINGQEALTRLHEQYFDAVLMDIQMPVLDGLSATRAIRDPGRYGVKSATPIIALTAHAMHGDKERFLQAGMNGYLPKPVNLADLDEELSRLAVDVKIA